jgi:ribosomal protein S18 acetylase RimI-like enzyme
LSDEWVEECGGESLDVRALEKAEANPQELAELAFAAQREHTPAQDENQGKRLGRIASRIANDCHDLIFVAYDHGQLVGWLAFYEMSGSSIAQIWDWHPVVPPGERGRDVANALLQKAYSHLREIGLHQVTVDFRVDDRTEARFAKYVDWYAQSGLTEVIQEVYYKVDIRDSGEVLLPDGYLLGAISETDLDDLFVCWTEVFSDSRDQFLLGLDARGKREFFAESWRREKPTISKASLTLSHNGRLIGLCRLLPLYEPTDGCLAPIGIVPEYRRQGLAQALLRVSMSRLRESGYHTMSCFVSTNNLAAVSLYKKLGFDAQYRINSIFGEVP